MAAVCMAPVRFRRCHAQCAGDPGSERGFGTGRQGGTTHGSTCLSHGPDPSRRSIQAIQEVCGYRGWNLLAAHVRSNHVHTVVEAEAEPERVMNDFKIYASRRLTRMSLDEPNRKRWARHGSTRWLGNHTTSPQPYST